MVTEENDLPIEGGDCGIGFVAIDSFIEAQRDKKVRQHIADASVPGVVSIRALSRVAKEEGGEILFRVALRNINPAAVRVQQTAALCGDVAGDATSVTIADHPRRRLDARGRER